MWQVDEVKVVALTRGDFISRWKRGMKPVVTTNDEKSAEVIVLWRVPPREGPNLRRQAVNESYWTWRRRQTTS
jgi:hypothetical protein